MNTQPKQPPRKNVALPPDTVARVDAFRRAQNIATESDALRRLIETGLNFYDTPDALFERCRNAMETGSTLGDVINMILSDHPLVRQVVINADKTVASLKTGDEIHYDKFKRVWDFIPVDDVSHSSNEVPF